jgi:hypothetical protein
LKNKQPKGLEPGIYFNLPAEQYHADPALSHSGMVDLLIHPLHYWHKSPLNPNRDMYKTSDAMKFGDRCHKLLLDERAFFDEFAVQGGKDLASKKKLFIRRSEWQRIKESVDMIKSVPDAYAYFSAGYPEVSIIWDDPETGIRLRIRVDWLRHFGGIDYKRVRGIENNPIGWAIAEWGYDMQEALYREGIIQIKRLIRQGKAKAHGLYETKWLQKFVDDDQALFCFLFQRSTEPFVFRILTFDSEILAIARTRVADAIGIYKQHIEQYGTAKWPAGNPRPEEFSIYNLPRRFIDQGVK